MKALSLFSGIGGIDLACEWAGIETVAFCEREPFPQKVLKKHWPNVPIYDDVCTLTKERLDADGIDTGAIGIIHGGYPCQPFSLAGKREGAEDDRHLWPEYFRLVQEIRPHWVVGENVVGHVTLGLDNVLTDLESAGYSARAFVIPAAAIGAVHRRNRVFVVAYSEDKRMERGTTDEIFREFGLQIESSRSFTDMPRGWDLSAPKLLRTHNGIPDRVDRTKALGNAVVPQQIYPILAAIKEIEKTLV